ncbi:MAG: DNA polymerase I [Sphaerochaetaceae bacterium]|jgi:DNA polymerase-1
MGDKKKSLFIIDGYSLIYRSYFAFINRPLKDPKGENVSALFGFFNTLLMLMRDYEPDYIVVALDSKGPTFRHEMYEPYKANRDAAPDDLHAQVPKIIDILDKINIKKIAVSGLEADDIIASLTQEATKEGLKAVMVTGDKDLLQLVNHDILALRPPKKGENSYTYVNEDEVYQQLNVTPSQVIDYLALIGDSSDNVPGVSGIGPKGAVKLLSEYPSLDLIYENIENLTPSVKNKLVENKEMAYLSKKLVTLKSDLFKTDSFDKEQYSSLLVQWDNGSEIFKEYGFNSILKTIGQESSTIESQVETHWNQKGSYTLVTSVAELDTLLEKEKIVAFDLETTNLDEMCAEIVGFSFTSKPFEAYYVPLVAEDKKYLDEDEVKKVLKKHLVERKLQLVGQNLKYDYKVLKRWGIESVELAFDTMIAAWLLDSSSLFNLDFLAQKYLDNYETIKYSDVVPDKKSLFSSVSLEAATDYGAEDADVTWRLYEVLKPLLKKEELEDLFYDVEMKLVKILADMELTGIELDQNSLEVFNIEITKRIDEIESAIFDEVGYEFNINSPKQLQTVLFEERNLTPGKKTKTGYSTAEAVLEKLAPFDIVPRLILENRTLVKLKNTYVETLPTMINPTTKRVHTSYSQTGTATGRLSSRNPNLQNIPIRSEEGRQIRKAFVAKEGSLFLSADYSQIELVVLAHLADDKYLKEAFIRGEDIHRHTASLIFEVFSEMVSSEQRRIAKTINFGVMYGMSAFRLSNELGISRQQAQNFITNYFERFSKVKDFMQKVIDQTLETKSVTTLLGRKRFIPEISSRNKMEQAQAERIAVNSAIQGSAADIMKLAMINVVKKMESKNLKSKLLLQVHDELIFEVVEDEMDVMKELVVNEMENSYNLSIPIKVSVETGKNWGEMS